MGGVGADHFRGDRRRRDAGQGVGPQGRDRDGQRLRDEADGLFRGEAVPGDDRRRVDPGPDEVGAALEQLGGHDDDRRRAVADLRVLQLGQVDQDLEGGGGRGGRAAEPVRLPARAPSPLPSPTLAAGCSTSSSFRMVAPSLVMVTSPMSSTSIRERRQGGRKEGVDAGAAAGSPPPPAPPATPLPHPIPPHSHLVEADGAEGRFHDVGDRRDGRHVLGARVRARRAHAGDGQGRAGRRGHGGKRGEGARGGECVARLAAAGRQFSAAAPLFPPPPDPGRAAHAPRRPVAWSAAGDGRGARLEGRPREDGAASLPPAGAGDSGRRRPPSLDLPATDGEGDPPPRRAARLRRRRRSSRPRSRPSSTPSAGQPRP